MRIGTQFKYACAELTVDGITIPWVHSITYLGVTLKLKYGSKFLIDLKPARTKFYRAFNQGRYLRGAGGQSPPKEKEKKEQRKKTRKKRKKGEKERREP